MSDLWNAKGGICTLNKNKKEKASFELLRPLNKADKGSPNKL